MLASKMTTIRVTSGRGRPVGTNSLRRSGRLCPPGGGQKNRDEADRKRRNGPWRWEANMTFPKNQQTRERGQTLGEAGAEQSIGFARKPMLDEHQERSLL